jgi:hypothetical protein
MTFSKINHYVPQWYQRRFFSRGLKEQKFYYLDLHPERVNHPDGSFHLKAQCRRWGSISCFAQGDLYTLVFGQNATDVIEKLFFGTIDQLGSEAVDFFSNYTVNARSGDAFRNLTKYLDAQILRTPKGLDYLKKLSGSNSHQKALDLMGAIWKYHITIWTEGVWEVLCCDRSTTKFIVTDHPATTYNKNLPPDSKECEYPSDAPIELVGTHTIFPLDLVRCLVITNLEYVRDPECNPLKVRENPRYFAETMFDIRKVQTGRQIPENEVIAINFILKNRARRYIASPEKAWLYPEEHLGSTLWNSLADRFFLMPDPRKVPFSTGIFVGFNDGTSWGIDEYGRHPGDPNPELKAKRSAEMQTFQKAKKAWDERFGPLSRDEMRRYFI